MSADADTLTFDADALRAKYEAERQKRLRADGNAQYVHLEGSHEHFLDDPYTEIVPREAIDEEIEVAILGGGFGGLLAAARLKEAGFDDLRIIERGGDFGGTWYWNRYPGAACDVESYVYLPLLEETGYIPSEKYARAGEIAEHAKAIGRTFDLYDRALFSTVVTEARWDGERARWIIVTDRGDMIAARFFVMCSGHYQNPKLPGIPGIERFKGHSFHTSRWDYDYTGGNGGGELVKLQDKTVGVIGTGATAIQCVPHLGRWAEQLYVFQRTPSSVDFRGDRPTDAAFSASLTPGWQKRRMDNFVAVTTGLPVEADLIDDSWTRTMYASIQKMTADMSMEQRGAILQDADYAIMEGVRARIDSVVKDEATADALKPWYNRLCKRPCFHDDYLETFNRPNVTLVDTEGRGVDAITEDSIVVAGKAYKVDCIVYATGFELAAFSALPVPVYGREGRSLRDKWKDGASTLHGFMSHDFPNFFLVSTTQSAWAANFPHMMEEQSRHIAYILNETISRGASVVEPTQAAEDEWVATHVGHATRMAKRWSECTPSYFNNEGQPSPAIARNGGFGLGAPAFINVLEKWRTEGSMTGLITS